MAKLVSYNRGDGNIALFNLSDADSKQTIFLGSGTAETLVRPALSRSVLMRADNPFFYEINNTPVVPTADETSGSSIYMPADSWEGDHWFESMALGGLAQLPTNLQFIRKNAVDTIITLLFYND